MSLRELQKQAYDLFCHEAGVTAIFYDGWDDMNPDDQLEYIKRISPHTATDNSCVGYLIDPIERNIRETKYLGSLDSILSALSFGPHRCERFHSIMLNGQRDTLYVDHAIFRGEYAEALESHWFKHKRYHSPIRGQALILGCQIDGTSKDPYLSIEDIKKEIIFNVD